MSSPVKSHSGSAASDITWPSLSSIPSPSHSPLKDAPVSDVTWGSLGSPINLSGPLRLSPSGTSITRSTSSRQAISHAPTASPLLKQVLSHGGNSPSIILSPSQKRQREKASQEHAPKRPRLSESGSSIHHSPSPLPMLPSSPGDSSSRGPTTPQPMDLDAMSDNQSISSSASTQRAKPPPGSPVWRHLQRVKLSRQNSPLAAHTPRGSPSIQRISPVQLSPVPHKEPAPPTQARPTTPTTKAGTAKIGKSHRDILYDQLEGYLQIIPSLSSKDDVDQLMQGPRRPLFGYVFAGSLLHAISRCDDPERRLWVLLDPSDRPQSLNSKPSPPHHPPTNFVGLYELEDFSILIWGHCELVDHGSLSLWFTLYDSQGKISTNEILKSYFPQIGNILRAGFAPFYRIAHKSCRPPYWTEQHLGLSQQDLGLLFCQLISSAIHDMPCDPEILKKGPPIGPVWPISMVEQSIRELLGQFVSDELSLECFIKGVLPECICIHGTHPQPDDTSPMDSSFPTNLSQSQAELEDCGVTNWFVKAGNKVAYRYTTPSDLSTPHTPPPLPWTRSPTEPVKNISEHQRTLRAGLSSNVFYMDHNLTRKLVALFEDDPLNLTAEDVPELFGRHTLWPEMGPTVHVIALTQVQDILGEGVQDWVLLDLTVESGRAVRMAVLLPPFEKFDPDIFARLSSSIIGALNCVLPRPRLVQHSSTVPQNLRAVVLPQPHTGDSLVLTMIAHFCGKLLNQAVRSVKIDAFRQSICYFYSHTLRSDQINSSFPWPGLIDPDGNLLVEKCLPEVERSRFSLASNRDPPPIETFPRTRSHTAAVSSPGPEAPFFIELAQPETTHPEGILVGTSGRSVSAFEKGALLGPYPSWPKSFPDRKLDTPNALSIDGFVDMIHSLGGPKHPDAQRFLLTMEQDEGFTKLNWLKDAHQPGSESIVSGWDTDSLTATFTDVPELLKPGNFYPYPKRDSSLLFNNELKVLWDGKPIGMHTCPNICFMTFSDGRFRLIVFLPRKREKRDKQQRLWRNIPTEDEMEDWYHLFLTALQTVSTQVPPEWLHAVEKTIEQLPTTYQMGKRLTTPSGQPRTFIARSIEPEIMNRTFKVMRNIVNTTERYASYRGYFFHLCGINLKLATHHILGREDHTPLKLAFDRNPILHWCRLNPGDIVADVGLGMTMHRASVPDGYERSTLLFRYWALCELLRPGYKTPQRDCYVHSQVVAGLHAIARKAIQEGGILKVQGYHKDFVLNYRDRDHSIGTNWTVDEALGLGNRQKFESQMEGFQKNQEEAGSYGVRVELRLNSWAANRLMQTDSQIIVERLVDSEAIFCHPTESVAAFKLTLSKTWSEILRRQSQLPREIKRSPEVMLLASTLAYFLKGLVKRPDDMSASREMAERLALTQSAKHHGLPFFRPGLLDDDNLRVQYHVEAHTFKILFHTNVIIPGGQTIKSSRLKNPTAQSFPLPPRPPSPTTPHQPLVNDPVRSTDSAEYAKTLVTIRLPRAIWSYFPDDRKAPGDMAAQLRTKPLKQRNWAKVVEPMNILHMLSGKFMDSFDRLFPPDWKVTHAKGDLKKYDRAFLQQIRDHINSKEEDSRSQYSEELRRQVRELVLAHYDYLPVIHAHKMWTFVPGVNSSRMFRIAPR